MHVTDEMVDLIREAIRFANWGAGQGLCPGAEEGISGPEDFLFEYSCKTGDEDWETLADRVSAALRAAPSAGRPSRQDARGGHGKGGGVLEGGG